MILFQKNGDRKSRRVTKILPIVFFKFFLSFGVTYFAY